MTTRVSQRSAGITRSEPHAGLHPGLGAQRAQRPDGLNHSGCQRTDKSERITYGNGELTRTQLR